jgi:Glycosyl transferase family 2
MRGARCPQIEGLLGAGLTNFLFSFHSSDDAEFRSLTGESLAKQLQAMDYLGERDFQFTTNTVVVAENAHRIPEIARRLTQTNTYLHNFIIMNSYYEWNNGTRGFGVMPRFTDLLPLLTEGIQILAEANIASNIRYAPLCGLPGLDKHIVGVTGVRYDPYEWMNHESHSGEVDPIRAALPWIVPPGEAQEAFRLYGVTGPWNGDDSIYAVRGAGGAKVFPKTCQGCGQIGACDGLDPKYLKHFGGSELVPYTDPDMVGALTNSRRNYAPAFLVKTRADTDMRAVTQRLLNPLPFVAHPKVSIVVTAYNKAATVIRAVRSALDQTYPHLEVIILDDGSTDDTTTALETSGVLNDPRVRLIRQANSGQPATARNAAITRATGALIMPLDADDWIARTFVAEAVAVFGENPAISIVYSDARYSRAGIVRARDYDYPRLLLGNQLSYCALYKRQVYDDVGGYRTNVRGVEDWDFWVAAGSRGHFGKRIPRPLFHYTENDDGVFAQDVANNIETKFARIVLNNHEAYQPSRIVWAKQRLDATCVPELATADDRPILEA